MTPIEGFHVDVAATELKALFSKKSRMHREKAVLYHKKADELKDDEDSDRELAYKMSGTPVQDLRDRAKRHERDTKRFAFYAEHTILSGNAYRLTDHDLDRLGLLEV